MTGAGSSASDPTVDITAAVGEVPGVDAAGIDAAGSDAFAIDAVGTADPEVADGAGASEGGAAGTSRPVGPVGAVDADPAAERALLIDLLIYAWDRARSAGVWARLAAGLEQVGVEVVRPDGEIFDPGAHEVGGVEKTSDPVLHNTIAETESAGFRDRGRIIREPVVVVYRVG